MCRDVTSIYIRANIPKASIIIPEVLLTTAIKDSFDFFPIKHTPKLKNSHQSAEPRKTPKTSREELNKLLLALTIPNPAKIAVNDIIVIGFVMVNKNVEK